MDGYEVCKKYLSVKFHFTQEQFDATKYKNPKYTYENYEKRNDRKFFEYVGRKFRDKEMKSFFISNMVEGEKYIIDMVDDLEHSVSTYNRWKGRMERLSYVFKDDNKNIKALLDAKELKFDDLFTTDEHKFPILSRLAMEKKITYETYVIMDMVLNFSGRFDKIYLGDRNHIWNDFSLRMRKYKFFFKRVEIDKFKHILREIYTKDG